MGGRDPKHLGCLPLPAHPGTLAGNGIRSGIGTQTGTQMWDVSIPSNAITHYAFPTAHFLEGMEG